MNGQICIEFFIYIFAFSQVKLKCPQATESDRIGLNNTNKLYDVRWFQNYAKLDSR